MYRYNSFALHQFNLKVLIKDFSQVARLSTTPLTLDQINQLQEIQSLKGWQLNNQSFQMKQDFTFPSFKESFAFMGSISAICDEMEHYPNWLNKGCQVSITLGSQDSKLTMKDMILAFTIEQVRQDILNNSVTYLTEQSKLVKSPQIIQLWNQNYSLQEEDISEQLKRNVNQY